VKPAPARIPDANLYTGSSPQERSKGTSLLQQTFGEVTQQVSVEHPAPAVLLSEIAAGKSWVTPPWKEREGVAVMSTRNADDGVIIL